MIYTYVILKKMVDGTQVLRETYGSVLSNTTKIELLPPTELMRVFGAIIERGK